MNPEMSSRSSVRAVRETRADGSRSLVHPEWRDRFPWLLQGPTTRGTGDQPFDLGLFSGGSPEAGVRDNWRELITRTGADAAVHAPQVHGAEVRLHRAAGRGLTLVEPCDGHVTTERGVLLAVTTADCVPVFLVDRHERAVGVVHAGWRGAAAGVLESAFELLERKVGVAASDVHVHLGPAICGACYEVGPEVFEALGRPVPEGPEPIDLRAVLAARAEGAGVPLDQVTTSEHCTLCRDDGLFSHRRGDKERQVGFIGMRP